MRPKLAHRSILPIVLFILVGAGPAAGQTVPNRPSYGTSDSIFYPVHHLEFRPFNSTTTWFVDEGLTSMVPNSFSAGVRIPNGAVLTQLELDYEDTDPALGVQLTFLRCDPLMNDCVSLGALNSNTGLGGESFVVFNLQPHTVDNSGFRYSLSAFTNNDHTQLIGAYIVYKLQVSAPPAVATFADVPTTHPFFRFVEALVDAGITAGCGGGNYCVNSPITRGEMAVFLAAALGLHFPG